MDSFFIPASRMYLVPFPPAARTSVFQKRHVLSDVFPRLPAQMDQTLGRTFFLLYLVLQTEIPDIPIDVGTI